MVGPSSRDWHPRLLSAAPLGRGTAASFVESIQWAYLRDNPPTGPVIGKASKVSLPLPWANREAVLRRDAEIRAIREEMQHAHAVLRTAVKRAVKPAPESAHMGHQPGIEAVRSDR